MFSRENTLFSLLFFTAMGLFPALAIGIAVLRYRLWISISLSAVRWCTRS